MSSSKSLNNQKQQQQNQTVDVEKTALERENEILDGIIRQLGQTETVANETLVNLNGQTEQLHKVNANLDQINGELDVSRYHLRTISSWFGQIANNFRSLPTVEKNYSQTTSQQSKNNNNASGKHQSTKDFSSTTTTKTSAKRPNNFEFSPQTQASLNASDAKLDAIASSISNLKTNAKLMNFELDKQENLIDTAHGKTDKAQHKLRNNVYELRKL